MLQHGEIDALISVMIPNGLGKSARRLFRDWRKVEMEYYRKTRIFPIMHTLVLKTSLYKEKPWLAVSFYRAFCRARDLAHQSLYDTDALTISLPWVVDDVEETRRLFGPQIWDYSIEGSLPTLNALLTYLYEQKLSRRRMSIVSSSCPISAPVSPIIFTPPERTDSLHICKGRSWSDVELSAGCWRQPISRIFVAGRLDQVGWAATSSSILSRGDSFEIQPRRTRASRRQVARWSSTRLRCGGRPSLLSLVQSEHVECLMARLPLENSRRRGSHARLWGLNSSGSE
jgi:hypothetical protein